ncbi:MAG: glycosyltransferase [Rhodospirillaceae bacterium]
MTWGLLCSAAPSAALLSIAIWIYLLLFRDGFWRADQRLGEAGPRGSWPAVCAVIPARNEADGIGRTVASLLGQDYPGALTLVVVDDNSNDGTADVAGAAAAGDTRLHVVGGAPLAPGWTGKLWAVSQGIDAAGVRAPDAEFLLLTDADIEHDPGNLRRLVFKAETEVRDLVSLMVMLRAEDFWERWLIPAFVFFFQKLYPFPAVNDRKAKLAAAAGGCMLVRRRALEAAGGIDAIKDALIDDCALARLIKGEGAGRSIWLGLATRTKSLRAYRELAEIWDMVARSAYVQLDHSPIQLFGTVIGMGVIYLVPPAALITGAWAGDAALTAMGGAAWLSMIRAYAPTLALYRLPAWRGLLLPLVAGLYTLMTLSSAWRHWRGRGGAWKGRHYGSG